MRALDLFAGPGGWDEGARALGIVPLGIDDDRDVCLTREAAGHRTLRGDVASLRPQLLAPCDLLIGSPPCPAFSTAGNRHGLRELDWIYRCAQDYCEGRDTRALVRPGLSDPSALLVVEPLRYAVQLQPDRIALEQVPPVLPFWQWLAGWLRLEGYSVWTGILSAEQFGVPQTRQRAFLLASRVARVRPPQPTHRRYVARTEDDGGGSLQLFDAGAPAPIVLPEDRDLLPWVSMADALGWTAGPFGGRPYLLTERQAHGVSRASDTPAMTLTASADNSNFRFVVNTGRDWKPGGSRDDAQTFDALEQPAPAVDTKGRWYAEWTEGRPATTVQGDPRVFQPGGHTAYDGRDNSRTVGRSDDAISVSLDDAAVLQGFPRGYPWQGNRTSQFRQVGNAVPPPLARAVLAALLEP